jgi:hypothetical protein
MRGDGIMTDIELRDLIDHLDRASAEFKNAERQRHVRRTQLRDENHLRARCARCEAGMLVFSPNDVVTREVCDFFRGEFQPGDLLCFWCWNDSTTERDHDLDDQY